MVSNRAHAAARPQSVDAVRYCDANADGLIEQYEDLSFEDVHSDLIPWLPETPAVILDVGAGTGRDARWLAERGFQVTAVEPSTGLRGWAMRQRARKDLDWVDDRLPWLAHIRKREGAYDFILCSAVLMFLSGVDRFPAIDTMLSLLKPGGRLAITVRLGVGEPMRGLYDLSEEDWTQLIARVRDARVVFEHESEDRWSRANVTWRTVVLEKARSPAQGIGERQIHRTNRGQGGL